MSAILSRERWVKTCFGWVSYIIGDVIVTTTRNMDIIVDCGWRDEEEEEEEENFI